LSPPMVPTHGGWFPQAASTIDEMLTEDRSRGPFRRQRPRSRDRVLPATPSASKWSTARSSRSDGVEGRRCSRWPTRTSAAPGPRCVTTHRSPKLPGQQGARALHHIGYSGRRLRGRRSEPGVQARRGRPAHRRRSPPGPGEAVAPRWRSSTPKGAFGNAGSSLVEE